MLSTENIPVLSLFCGCGGLDLGFTREGFQVLLALDANATAVRTYNHNHNEGIARVADLADLDGQGVLRLLDKEHIATVPRGVIGGPPCQPFSLGNVTNSHSNGLRRTLPARYAMILKSLNKAFDLDFFVFENVEGITFEKHRRDFAQFKTLFEDAGFNLFEGLLDAQDFGVPQQRPRVFVVGWNKEKFGPASYQFPSATCSTRLTVADAISGLKEPVLFQRGLVAADFPVHPNHWTMQPKSKRFQDGSLREGQTRGRSFRVLRWNKPSWTVAYGNREIHIHPSGTRRLSIYEAMLLQGFPEGYELLGNLSEQVRQVSDAVPPPLASSLARSIRLFLDGDESARIPSNGQLELHLPQDESEPSVART